MKLRSIILTEVLLLLQLCTGLWAHPTTANEAKMVVTGWLKADNQPLDMALSKEVIGVETFTNDDSKPIYHIVYLEPTGFVIVSADDLLEPIIGFVNGNTYNPSPENPLGALVTRDLNGRIESASSAYRLLALTPQMTVTASQKKWRHFVSQSIASDNGFELMSEPPIKYDMLIDDIRITPFLKTKWAQEYVYSSLGGSKYCYNYYTPEHYPSGCVATAMAQLMRYYGYPTEPNDDSRVFVSRGGLTIPLDAQASFTITVDGVEQTATLIGGDGAGGPYDFNAMESEPNYNDSTVKLQAIGSICYDAGISVNMDYKEEGSGTNTLNAADAFKKVFKYSNAVKGSIPEDNSASVLIGMINPNLDAKKPVILGIGYDDPNENGHAVVCDGYGYNSSTLYHHLNMGFSGQADCWYNLPNVDCSACSDQTYKFTVVDRCVYNVFKSGTGEIISGRVLYDNGEPAENVSVNISLSNSGDPCEVFTDANGIFAFDNLDPNTTYTISIDRNTPLSRNSLFLEQNQTQQVRTGSSIDNGSTSGNVWGVYFQKDAPKLYVDDNGANDPWPNNPNYSDPHEDGSAEHPFDTIQEAIDAAMPGDMVIVLQGVYRGEGNRDLDFKCKPITVQSENPDSPDVVANTIVDCQASRENPHRGFIFQSGEKATSVLNGLTITNGYSWDEYPHENGDVIYQSRGSGIYCTNDSCPRIAHCVLHDNHAQDGFGGGMYNYYSSPIITDCTFSGNYASEGGGGMFNFNSNPDIVGCLFESNESMWAGGMFNEHSSLTVTDCNFIRNKAGDSGGGIENTANSNAILINCKFIENEAVKYGAGVGNYESNPTITDCNFIGNKANECGGGINNFNSNPDIAGCLFESNESMWGGGMFNEDSSLTVTDCNFIRNKAAKSGGGIENTTNGNATVINCKFIENEATLYGAGIENYQCSPTITNCIFIGNKADEYGGGIENNENSSPAIINCTFVANSAVNNGGGIDNYNSSATVINCILWNNFGRQISGDAAVSYSDIQGGYSGEHNINSDPLFADADGIDNIYGTKDDDLHLLQDSPCIDTGNNIALPRDISDLDVDGNTKELVPFDFERKPRIQGMKVDMGAFEF